MKENSLIMLFIVASMAYSQESLAKNQCSIKEVINLSVFKKDDYKFYNYICDSDSDLYLKSYIGSQNNKVFLGEYSDFSAKESPELLAVSIYKKKTKKPPLLITLNSASYCCTPQMEGRMYQVNLYQISAPNSMILKNITNIFGANAEGFDGKVEGRVHYNYKTIAEIKKWLDRNY